MPDKPTRLTIVLALVAAGMFLAECALFHFPFATGFDVIVLAWMTFGMGVLAVLTIDQTFALDLTALEILSLSCALGFGFGPIFIAAKHILGIGCLPDPIPGIIGGAIAALLFPVIWRKKKQEYANLLISLNNLCIFIIGTLLLFAVYNLQQFHYGADGSIITRGLFGVDIPFLAGEVHGIRDFGTLRDLHQMGQPWHYHDWTYQLLAMLPRDRTLGDLAFAAPLVGYTMLALSIFTLSLRLTGSKNVSYIAVAVWLLTCGSGGWELGIYAVSPSFVFGTMIFLNIVLALDLLLKTKERKNQWIVSAILFFLVFELSQTKLSSYLVIVSGLGLLGLMKFSKERNIGITLMLVSILSFVIVFLQNTSSNPMMPSNDFLIGAPLLGYANHLAAILHISVSGINPVSHGFSFHWRSILMIPFFVFHFLRFVIVDPKVLSAIVAIVFLRTVLWKESKEIVWLLIILIVLGFLFPVLYSPAWYPLALSFYTPMLSVQASVLLVVVWFGMLLQKKMTKSERSGMGVIGLLCLIGAVLQVHFIMQENTSRPFTLSSSFVEAMNYLQSHTNDTALIATRRFDFDTTSDESYYWFSALSGREVISEGAKYGSLLAAVADTDSEKGLHRVPIVENLLRTRRNLLDTIYTSRDSTHVNEAIAESGVSYIVEDSSSHLAYSKLAFPPVFQSGEYWILKVR